MRRLILLAGAAVALSACGSDQQSENNVNVDQALGAENIVANDITAIDAVTAAAANMAADVEVGNELIANLDGNAAAERPRRPGTSTRPARPRSETPAAEPATEPAPASNSATNSTE